MDKALKLAHRPFAIPKSLSRDRIERHVHLVLSL
jgi:hypothetical protein